MLVSLDTKVNEPKKKTESLARVRSHGPRTVRYPPKLFEQVSRQKSNDRILARDILVGGKDSILDETALLVLVLFR